MSERFVCPAMALHKHCMYFLFVLSCVTDCVCVLYVVSAICRWLNKDSFTLTRPAFSGTSRSLVPLLNCSASRRNPGQDASCCPVFSVTPCWAHVI